MDDDSGDEDLTLLELQRARLQLARERRESLQQIASNTRWTMVAVAAHAGVSVLQDQPQLVSAVRLALALLGLV